MRYLTTIPLKLKTQNGEVELKPGDTFTPKSEDAIRGLLTESKVKPVTEVMAEKYQSLADWLHQFDLSSDEIKETLPDLYLDIQDCIQRADDAFVIEDMPAFENALERVRLLYTEALLRCDRKIAVRVWSEPLQTHLWVVADNEDIKALRSKGVSEAIYTAGEIKKLKGLSKDSLREIHKVKEVFENSKIEEKENHDANR